MSDRQSQHQDNQSAEHLRHRTSSIAKVETLIDDVDFPCSKEDLLGHARNKGASQEVMDILEQFPDKQYASTADVARSMGSRH